MLGVVEDGREGFLSPGPAIAEQRAARSSPEAWWATRSPSRIPKEGRQVADRLGGQMVKPVLGVVGRHEASVARNDWPGAVGKQPPCSFIQWSVQVTAEQRKCWLLRLCVLIGE